MFPVPDSERGKQRCPCQCHPDWSWLKFGDTKISPADIDGIYVVERSGQFLIMETKEEGETLWQGQKLLLEQFSRKPGFTVIVLRGPKSNPTSIQRVKNGVWQEEHAVDRDGVQMFVDIWFRIANTRAA